MLEQDETRPDPGGRPESHALPASPGRAGLLAKLRNYLFAGIIVTAPIGITVLIVWQVIEYFDATAAALIPARWNPETYLPFSVPGIGFVLVLGLLILIGWFAAGLVGRTLMRIGERIVNRTPVVRGIYGTLKQIFETVLSQSAQSFREVVLIEWPRRGCWSIGFLTGTSRIEIDELAGDELVNVFMPCTPNPTTGYLMFVSRRDVIPLDISIEDGMKMIISGGIVNLPLRERPPQPGTAGAPARPLALAGGDQR